ncbi:sulfite reductase subunit alpha [Pseudoalteromonas sp. SS15]|uniref:sulfite reductase subunit alpha n=1 Tax=Pseudoalteromonas sp. SS15 TaxID=3139393 RepID=UPI003BAD3FF6
MLNASPFIQAGLLLVGYFAFTLFCYRKVIVAKWQNHKERRAKMLIAYASESGSGEQLARELHVKLKDQGDPVLCISLNQVTEQQLKQADTLLIIASTYGEGEAPDNGRHFQGKLDTFKSTLAHLNYAVLALGDKAYSQYCQFGLALNQALQSKHCKPLFAPILVDKLDENSIHEWYSHLLNKGLLAEAVPRSTLSSTQLPIQQLKLTGRQQVNINSPGAPLFEINLAVPNDLTWQAGDIARLHIKDTVREYSIASVPQEQSLKLLVREQKHPTGELGLGSGWLCHQADLDSTQAFSIRANPKFNPLDEHKKLILIGNGSGLAGLRGHLKHRELKQHHENWLLYGERCAEHDLPWHLELTEWFNAKHLTEIDLAFSRQTADSNIKVGRCHSGYVQDALLAQQAKLKDWINNGAAIFICGSLQGMAKDVESMLIDILGQPVLSRLERQELYRKDVY